MKITQEEPQYYQDESTRSWHLEDREMADKRACDLCRKQLADLFDEQLSDDITAERLAEVLQALAINLLADEIGTDPEGRGYADKTDEEIAALVNSPYSVEVVIGMDTETDPDNPREIKRREFRKARLAIVWEQVPYLPNSVSADDVREAR